MLDNQRIEARLSAKARDFPVLKNVQTGCGANPTFFSAGTGELFPKGKAAEA
jgi:hypothetical protein